MINQKEETIEVGIALGLVLLIVISVAITVTIFVKKETYFSAILLISIIVVLFVIYIIPVNIREAKKEEPK